MSTADARSPLARLWAYEGNHHGRVRRAVLWTVLNKIFDVAPEILIGMAVDVVVSGNDSLVGQWFGVEGRERQLVLLAAVNFLIWLLESFTEWLSSLEWRRLSQTVEHELRMDAYGHVQRLELSYFEDRSSGGLMAVLNDDVNQLERFLDVGANEIIRTAVNVALVGLVFAAISWQMFVVAFLPMPVIIWGSVWYQRRFQPRYARVREQVGVLSGTLANNLGGITTIKAFTAEKREAARVDADSRAYMAANEAAIRLSSAFVPLIRVAILIGFTATLLIGGHQAIGGELRVGLFSVLVFMTQRLLWPLTRLGEVMDLYQRGMASTRRILDLIDTPVTIAPGARDLPSPPAGAVRFDDVHFRYSTGPEVLRPQRTRHTSTCRPATSACSPVPGRATRCGRC